MTMRLWLMICLLLMPVWANEQGHWDGPPSAAIYSAAEISLSAEQLAQLAPGAKIEIADARHLLVIWPDVQVEVFLGYDGDFANHLAGMRNFVAQMSADDPEGGQRVLARIDTFRGSCGTRISPAFDADGKAIGLVKKLAARWQGTIFTAASFYDHQGQPLLYNGGPEHL